MNGTPPRQSVGVIGRSRTAVWADSTATDVGEFEGAYVRVSSWSRETLGLVGGIGPESTIAYYRAIMAAAREIASASQPPVLINSIDVNRVLSLVEANELAVLTDYLVEAVERLAKAMADIVLIRRQHATHRVQRRSLALTTADGEHCRSHA